MLLGGGIKVNDLYTLNGSPFDYVISTPTRELVNAHLSLAQCLRKYGEERLIPGEIPRKLPKTTNQ